MWIDGSHCTKPCSVVISRISTKYKAIVHKQGQESVKEKVPVLKQKKAQRTSFERALVIQSGVTGQERKSSRLHGPKSRLRTRPALNYSATMPAPVNKDFSPLNDERIKATHSSAYYKASEWQKSTSSNPFKLRLKCLNKEKPLLTKRKWTLQSSKSEDSSKFAKEEKQTSETESKAKEDLGKKVGLSQSAPATKCANNSVTKQSKPTMSSEKSPLSKLVISCKKAYRYHQPPAFHKSGNVKTKEEEPKPEGSKVHKKMNAYTVYTKLRENSIESINCKRYKKRKEVKNKVERCRVRVRDANTLSVMSELGNLKNDGSVEDEVRATLDSLLRDVVSAELDQLLNLEDSTSELKDLLRNFCSQYGYNYDKDFSDPQNSVLSFKVTDSASITAKKCKSKTEEQPVQAAVPEPEPKACPKLPTPPRSLKKRRRRKWDSSDDSDEQECPEMLSAMMRSRSKDRRNRLSRQENSSPVSAAPALRKRQRRVSVPLGQFFSMSEDSQMESAESPDAKPSAHSASELSLKRYSDEDEETDCGDNTLSGHMYIPPLSSDDTSEEEQQRPETNAETSEGKNSEQKPADSSEVTAGDGARTGSGDASSSKLDTSVPAEPSAEPKIDQRPNSAPDAWSDFAQAKSPADKPKSDKCSASLPNLNSLFRTLKDKSKNGVVPRTQVQVGEEIVTKKDSEPQPEDNIKYSANSPDLDWDSNNLVICLDPQPSENSMDKASTDESRKRAEAPASSVREILYHTPKFHLLETQVPELFKANAKQSGSLPVTCTSPTCEVESEESAKEDDQDARSRSSPQARETNAKKSNTGSQQATKHHRTPVQKVLPHVKTLSPTQKNVASASQASRKESSSPANQKPRPPPKIKAVAEVADVPPSTQTPPASYQPTTSSSPSMPPAVYEAVAAPTVYVPPLPTPSLQNGSVPALAVVPTSLQALSELSVSPLSVTVPSSLPIHTSSASDLFPISAPLPVVSLSPLTVNIPSEHSPKTRSLDVTAVAADISQLANHSALDISILRSLLLDPPPDGGPPSEIHNLILQKAKELEEPEQSEDCDFNLPVITNVVSLNEEVIRQAAEKLKSSKQSSTPQVSPVLKVESPRVQEQPRQRSTDSPEIVEEKFKSSHASSKNQHSSKSSSTLGDNINDVLRNLQLEIRNLEKMAEDKKKEYFLIMYVRNFKRDTLRRLHEGLQSKSNISPTSRKSSQSVQSTTANEPGQTHPKETCLVRPMVQAQPSQAPLLPSPKAVKVPEIKSNTAEPQKGMTILKLLSESQAISRSYSPEVRHSPGSSTPSPIHSSLAALSKIESELKVGFRSYQCPNNKKESTPEKNCDSGIASFAKYEPSKLSLKTSPPVSVAQQGAQLPPSSSAVTVGYVASPVSTTPHVTPLAPSKPPPPPPPPAAIHNPSLSSWKGTVSAYIQNSRGPGKPHYPGPNPPGPPPAYPNTVKNLLKQASAGAAGPVPSLVKDFTKTAENSNQTQRAHVPQGSTQVNSPPFLDYYPFQTVASAANNYIQSSPFWPASLPTNKPNTSLASLQAARDLYLNSLAFGAWRTVKNAEQENERFVEKNSSEKLWNPAASATAPGRPFMLPETQDQGQNLVSHRPFLYGPLRKCVVCKVADAQFICSGCGKDWYCSVTCQRQNWRVHSRSCVSSST